MSEYFSLAENCELKTLPQDCGSFSCGDDDLDEFFKKDAHSFAEQLFGKSYCFVKKGDGAEIVCAFTIAHSAVKNKELPDESRSRVGKNVPMSKRRFNSYPAVLIGRLGVNADYCGKGVGTQVLDMLKDYFRNESKAACRFVVVDAYNNEKTLKFYQKNGFVFVFPNEKEEMKFSKRNKLQTRLMVFDLLSFCI